MAKNAVMSIFKLNVRGQGRIQNIQKGVARSLNSSILDTFYFSEAEFYKNNTKFQRKRSGQGLIGPPLKPPMEVVYAKSARTVF